MGIVAPEIFRSPCVHFSHLPVLSWILSTPFGEERRRLFFRLTNVVSYRCDTTSTSHKQGKTAKSLDPCSHQVTASDVLHHRGTVLHAFAMPYTMHSSGFHRQWPFTNSFADLSARVRAARRGSVVSLRVQRLPGAARARPRHRGRRNPDSPALPAAQDPGAAAQAALRRFDAKPGELNKSRSLLVSAWERNPTATVLGISMFCLHRTSKKPRTVDNHKRWRTPEKQKQQTAIFSEWDLYFLYSKHSKLHGEWLQSADGHTVALLHLFCYIECTTVTFIEENNNHNKMGVHIICITYCTIIYIW